MNELAGRFVKDIPIPLKYAEDIARAENLKTPAVMTSQEKASYVDSVRLRAIFGGTHQEVLVRDTKNGLQIIAHGDSAHCAKAFRELPDDSLEGVCLERPESLDPQEGNMAYIVNRHLGR